MTLRDWNRLIGPEFWDPLADLPEYLLPPFSRGDIEKWGECIEKELAMEKKGLES